MSHDDRIYLGLDPGRYGAVACIDGAGDYVDHIDFARVSPAEVADFLREYGPRALAALETVSPGPAMGRGTSMKLGRAEGELRGMLLALQVRFQEVAPSAWQGALGCRTKGNKRVTLERAQARWPHVAMTVSGKSQPADALLIADWCRRFH